MRWLIYKDEWFQDSKANFLSHHFPYLFQQLTLELYFPGPALQWYTLDAKSVTSTFRAPALKQEEN
jgi:hypothetical protein